jgi:SAM-dependent methyltransferase
LDNFINNEAARMVNPTEITRQNISYYNEIASGYDAILEEDAANAAIRSRVAQVFTSLVRSGCIMDFGGGTGQDSQWLAHRRYHVIFCEPSPAMREIAMKRSRAELPDASILFLDDNETDFRSWTSTFPLERRVDAVLANFAVMNCIPDIDLVFDKLAAVVKPGGWVVALVLENGLGKRLRSNFRSTLASLITGKPVRFFVDHNNSRQLVYIHSMRNIRRAIRNNFNFSHQEQLHGPGFRLICLQRR